MVICHILVLVSKSIRISDELADLAEAAAVVAHRSPPQQVEHWAQIGRVMEPALSYQTADAIKRAGRVDLDAALDAVGTPEAVRRTREIIRRTSGGVASSDR